MSYTQKLIAAITASKKKNLPREVIDQAKLMILDTLGCAIGGQATTTGEKITAMAKSFSGHGDATIIGDGGKASAPFACWANSSLANLLDMDDVYGGTAHQANCLVPTALGVGETRHASGMDVIRAIVLGFEVGSRIMAYCWPSPLKAKTYFPSTWQVFNAVVACGSLLNLPEKQLYHAFGLAGTVPPLPLNMEKFVEKPMGFTKNVFGWTTFTGVFWTLLAQKGIEGSPRILDGDAGFWAIMGSDFRDFDKLLEDFDNTYHILETKFKPYPLCTWGHSSIDAATKIFAENNISADEIESIEIKTIRRAADFLADTELQTIFDGQFSLPHAVAMVALGCKPGPEWMTAYNLKENDRAASLAQKVTVVHDPGADQVFNEEKGLGIPSAVTVATRGGHVYSETVKYSWGTPKNPLTTEDIHGKFSILCAPAMEGRRIDEIMDVVEQLEKLDDICRLTEKLKGNR